MGFEPMEVTSLTGFQDQHHKPLGHLSKVVTNSATLFVTIMDVAGLEPASPNPNVLIHSSREVFYRDITTRPIVSIGLEPIL